MIYLDNASTTYPKPEEVYLALDKANRTLAFNAGRGLYKEAEAASNALYAAREEVASLVGKNPDSIVFTSSATEALNMIIAGLDLEPGDNVYISPFEHNAIVRPLFSIQKKLQINIIVLPFNKTNWLPNSKEIANMFAFRKPKAVFLSQISNVVGIEIDYQSIFSISAAYKSVNVLDSAQAMGLKNPNLKNVDYCVFAGHKTLLAGFGIAGFIINTKTKLKIVKSGGNGSDSLNHDMPENGFARYEAGSPNIVAAYGLTQSIKWIKENGKTTKELQLAKYAIEKMRAIPRLKLYMPENTDNYGIISFNLEGYDPEDVAQILSEEYDIKVRAGYHCSPFVHEFIDSLEKKGTVRASFGPFTTQQDVDALLSAIKELI